MVVAAAVGQEEVTSNGKSIVCLDVQVWMHSVNLTGCLPLKHRSSSFERHKQREREGGRNGGGGDREPHRNGGDRPDGVPREGQSDDRPDK